MEESEASPTVDKQNSGDTIEIDPKNLSDKVRQDLIEEADIDPKEAKDMSKKTRINEMTKDQDPNKVGFLNWISKTCSNYYNLITQDLKVRSQITDMEPQENDKILIHLKHPKFGKEKIELKSDSQKLANLKSYYGVCDTTDLIEKQLTLKRVFNKSNNYLYSGAGKKREYVVPNNVSLMGRLSYKSYTITQGIRNRMNQIINFKTVDDLLANTLTGIVLYFIITVVSAFIASGGVKLIESYGLFGDVIGSILYAQFIMIFFVIPIFITTLLMTKITTYGVYKKLKDRYYTLESF